jgi:hypothetical protein
MGSGHCCDVVEDGVLRSPAETVAGGRQYPPVVTVSAGSCHSTKSADYAEFPRIGGISSSGGAEGLV